MKIIDCEKQLKKDFDLFNKLSLYNEEMCNIIIDMDKQNIDINKVSMLVNILVKPYKILPHDICNEIDNCFKDFEISEVIKILDNAKQSLEELSNIFNMDKDDMFTREIKHRIGSIDYLKSTKILSDFKIDIRSIDTVLNLCLRNFHIDRIKEAIDLQKLFYACTNAKMIIWDYIVSLELPTKGDYDN